MPSALSGQQSATTSPALASPPQIYADRLVDQAKPTAIRPIPAVTIHDASRATVFIQGSNSPSSTAEQTVQRAHPTFG